MEYGEQVLTGERLRLRPVQEEDLGPLEQWWNDPATLPLQSLSVLPRPSGGHLESFRGWYRNTDGGNVGFAVERQEDGQLLGAVVLFGATVVQPSATFAIQLGPHATGRGYGLEATRLTVDYGFRVLPLHRIQLLVWAFNGRARTTYERAGFLQEGCRREVIFRDGRWEDEIQMAMTRGDWEAQRRTPTR